MIVQEVLMFQEFQAPGYDSETLTLVEFDDGCFGVVFGPVPLPGDDIPNDHKRLVVASTFQHVKRRWIEYGRRLHDSGNPLGIMIATTFDRMTQQLAKIKADRENPKPKPSMETVDAFRKRLSGEIEQLEPIAEPPQVARLTDAITRANLAIIRLNDAFSRMNPNVRRLAEEMGKFNARGISDALTRQFDKTVESSAEPVSPGPGSEINWESQLEFPVILEDANGERKEIARATRWQFDADGRSLTLRGRVAIPQTVRKTLSIIDDPQNDGLQPIDPPANDGMESILKDAVDRGQIVVDGNETNDDPASASWQRIQFAIGYAKQGRASPIDLRILAANGYKPDGDRIDDSPMIDNQTAPQA